jgi:tRNA threonylcarbamoyladenosine biosynthesis protein TsaE
MCPPEPQHPVCCWTSPAPDSTREAARLLAGALESAWADDVFVIALQGELGAGKTLFVQGLAEGLGLDPSQVTSPTFTIVSEYSLSFGGRFHHVDLYRLATVGELEATGFVDLLEPGNLLAVEWADRLPSALPSDRLALRLERVGLAAGPEVGDATAPATPRRLTAAATGAISGGVLARWEQALAGAGLLQKRG